jgi:hypothetical protein
MSLGRSAVILLVLLFCAGCNTRGYVDPATATMSDDSGYALIGMRPDYMDVAIYTVDISDGTVRYSYPATFSGPPEDGFILVKAPAGSFVAVTKAVVRAWVRGMGAYDPVCPAVFKVDGGKITYATTMVFEPLGGLFGPLEEKRVQEFDSAREFMKKHYPSLAGSLVLGTYKTMPMARGDCN